MRPASFASRTLISQNCVSADFDREGLRYDERASDLFAANLRRYLTGEPLLNLVDKERGY